MSPDISVDGYFSVHELFLGAGKYLIENVANAHLLPLIGAYGIVLPLKLSEGAEAPVRFIAFVLLENKPKVVMEKINLKEKFSKPCATL